jgi:chromate reductase
MKNIIIIGASTSSTSINKSLANYTASLLKNVELTKIDIHALTELPVFSEDHEKNEPTPEAVIELNKLFKETDGFIISHAEHNGSFSAGYKNAIDWVSRQGGKIFNNKPVMIMATSNGARGGSSVLNHAETIYPHRGAIISGVFSLPSYSENFKEGKIINKDLNKNLLAQLAIFEAAIK